MGIRVYVCIAGEGAGSMWGNKAVVGEGLSDMVTYSVLEAW